MSNQIADQKSNSKNSALKTEIILDFSKESQSESNDQSSKNEEISSNAGNSMSIESTLSVEIPSENSMAVNYTPNDSDSLGSSVPNFSMSPEEARRTVDMQLEGDVFGCLERYGKEKARKLMKNNRAPLVKIDNNLISGFVE